MMTRLTELLGFQARYALYPLLAIVIAAILRYLIHRYLVRWAARTESQTDDKVVTILDAAVPPLLLMAVLYSTTQWIPLSERVILWSQRALLIASVGLSLLFAARVVSTILEGVGERQANLKRFIQPLRTLSRALFVLGWVALTLKVLNFNLSGEAVRLVRIAGIATGAYVILKILHLAVAQIQRLAETEDRSHVSEVEKRARTLGNIINNAGFVLILGVAIMMTLSEFGLNITPIITGAGIAGLAVGFGAQNLVRDVISGFFLILEDQVRVGDVAVINGTGGMVEAINLRTVVLRDLEGVVHIFPNGEIKQVSNRTKEWSRSVVDVRVAYKEDVDHVMDVLKDVGLELSADPAFGPMILEPLEVFGVDNFGDSQVTIKIAIKTLPLKQWTVGRELRRRIKKAFDQNGIEIPFPHLSVYFGEASKPFELKNSPADHGRTVSEGRLQI
jgi:small conductance mechanosensitive channel